MMGQFRGKEEKGMAYYAKLNEENKVVTVCPVGNEELLDGEGNEVESAGAKFLSNLLGEGNYIQTSYNTQSGVHHGADGKPDGGKALRANYCGKGWNYHPAPLDIFSPPQPFPSWTLDEVKGQWVPPVPYPELIEGEHPPNYQWNEDAQQWDLVATP